MEERLIKMVLFNSKNNKGFTLLELLVVIAIIGILSSVVMVSLSNTRAKARDARRISDVNQIKTALELYYNNYGQYPNPTDSGCGGWDTTGNTTFILPLTNSGYLPSGGIKDPTINNTCGNYSYYRYSPETGCDKTFYVLGVRDMETSGNPHSTSPGWSCTNRNWQGEFEWVTGKYEN